VLRSTHCLSGPAISRTCRGVAAGLLAVAWMATTAPLRAEPPARVQLRTADGRSFEGELIRDVPSHVLLRIGGVEARFERGDVARLSPAPDAAARLAERRAALPDDDLAGRMALAREMFAADLLDAARWELVLLQAALAEEAPGRARVAALLSAVEARRALQRGPAAAVSATPGGPDAADPASPVPAPRASRPAYLSEADINLVRVYEIDLNAADAERVEVPEEVLREAMTEHPNHPAVPAGEADRKALMAGSGRDQLAFLFGLEARSLYGRVRVHQDPETLAAFRREINPGHVARYFEPHFGGGQVPGLDLVRYRPNTTAEAYTNFVALCRFSYEGRPMVDRYNPGASLLLQWALPRDEARHPAPDVPGWRPRFRSTRDPRYERLHGWIDGLVKFDPDYAALLPPADADADADADAGDGTEDPPGSRGDEVPDGGGNGGAPTEPEPTQSAPVPPASPTEQSATTPRGG